MSSKRAVRKTDRVEMSFLEAVRRRCPGSMPVLEVLGDIYTRVGRYEEGLKIDLELSRLRPDEALVWYNLACSYALLNRKEEALGSLCRALALGYRDFEWLKKDPDLASLHGDPRFAKLILHGSPKV